MNPNSPQNPTSASGAETALSESQAVGDRSTPKQKIRATAQQASEQIKRAATNAATQVRDEAQHIAAARKDQAASRLDSYGSAAHRSAQELERDDPNIAWLAHRAADQLQGAANYVRSRDFNSLRSDAEGWARNHPAVFFGGLFAAGLVLGNVLKASGRACSCEADDSGTQNENDASQASEEPSYSAPSSEI